MDADEYLTPEEVAVRLKVAERTVYGWLRSGRLHGVKLGRLWRVREGDLDVFLVEPEVGLVARERPAPYGQPLREYTRQQIEEFLEADKLDPEVARKVERLLTS